MLSSHKLRDVMKELFYSILFDDQSLVMEIPVKKTKNIFHNFENFSANLTVSCFFVFFASVSRPLDVSKRVTFLP